MKKPPNNLLQQFQEARKKLEEMKPVPVIFKQNNGCYRLEYIPKKLYKGKGRGKIGTYPRGA